MTAQSTTTLRLPCLSLWLSAAVLAACSTNAAALDRAAILAAAKLPPAASLPVPAPGISLPDDWHEAHAPLLVHLSKPAPAELSARRVPGPNGRVCLELRSAAGALSGTAQVSLGKKDLGQTQVNGSLWLWLQPRIARIPIEVYMPDGKEPVKLSVPTAMVEARGRRIFLNGEPFLMKGATGHGLTPEDADYVHSLGLNTLRGLSSVEDGDRFGFMCIASLNFGDAGDKKFFTLSDAEFKPHIAPMLKWLEENSATPIASPHTLILQLGNERTGAGNIPPGTKPMSMTQNHIAQLLVEARNLVKPLAPALLTGYANQDYSFLAPDCMDVYMHNSYLDKDRYGYPWNDFIRWQGCLPTDGKEGQGRPFVNSEFGANRYLCQSYHAGPNNPFLERIHAWNFPCRWAEFMDNGTIGGSIYCLYDLESPRDQGCSRFGILTQDRQPKLGCWEVGHMWRDFEVQLQRNKLLLTFKRDYWARDCSLQLVAGGKTNTVRLDDFAPHSTRTIAVSAPAEFAWNMDFTTHGGLVNKAGGAWPSAFEERLFLQRLKGRDTFPFLSELFDTEVLTAEGKPAPRTLVEMTNKDGVIPVALRKRNGVTYLLLIARENPHTDGPLRKGITIDVAFKGKVVMVDDMTGRPTAEIVDAAPVNGGLRLKNIQAARIPGAIGERSTSAFALPIYRISP